MRALLIGWIMGGKTPVACSTMSTRVVTTMMTRTPATTARIDFLFIARMADPVTKRRSQPEKKDAGDEKLHSVLNPRDARHPIAQVTAANPNVLHQGRPLFTQQDTHEAHGDRGPDGRQ